MQMQTMQGKECCKDAEQCIVDLQPPLLQANPVGLSISANIQQSNMEKISRIGISNLPNQTAPCPAMPSHAQHSAHLQGILLLHILPGHFREGLAQSAQSAQSNFNGPAARPPRRLAWN
jgi:hypothetical protein